MENESRGCWVLLWVLLWWNVKPSVAQFATWIGGVAVTPMELLPAMNLIGFGFIRLKTTAATTAAATTIATRRK